MHVSSCGRSRDLFVGRVYGGEKHTWQEVHKAEASHECSRSHSELTAAKQSP